MNLTEGVKSTRMNAGVIYRLWREDSTWAHATGFLAGYFAPENGETVDEGKPPVIDHLATAHSVAFSSSALG